MITFGQNEANKQFLSINPKTYPPYILFTKLKTIFPTLNAAHYKVGKREILFEIQEDICFDFSLKELRTAVNKITECLVYAFTVDFNEPNQRYIDFDNGLLVEIIKHIPVEK